MQGKQIPALVQLHQMHVALQESSQTSPIVPGLAPPDSSVVSPLVWYVAVIREPVAIYVHRVHHH